MWPLEKNAPPPGCNVFQPTGIIFELVQHIIGMNLLTKFHEDWPIHPRFSTDQDHFHTHPRKDVPPRGGHVFQATGTIFELVQDNIGTNLLTKFHDNWTINVTSRV
ncbi:hypothetical protein DPMN_080586 [Dreissena polymorpha]|uniref:Uncharacterized protein n=1 Tax=Dreissena polymorpha TaxID=45954 RepID=A0A9D4BJD2_DREPO|nr:hypothetical protein DPMN_080586 [Dreissena polymorpha]